MHRVDVLACDVLVQVRAVSKLHVKVWAHVHCVES
jgi:hypothetical protein